MWQLWCLGDPARKYAPLRLLDPIDVGDDTIKVQKNNRRCLSDLKSVMGRLETDWKSCAPWPATLTLKNVNEMYDSVVKVLAISDKTPKGRKRRIEQIVWTTVVREFLRPPKQARETPNADNEVTDDDEDSAPHTPE